MWTTLRATTVTEGNLDFTVNMAAVRSLGKAGLLALVIITALSLQEAGEIFRFIYNVSRKSKKATCIN